MNVKDTKTGRYSPPHRRLRNSRSFRAVSSANSPPHRRLRKYAPDIEIGNSNSPPHRRLRNVPFALIVDL